MIKIDRVKCTGCGACVNTCPARLLCITDGKADIADQTECIDCGHCKAVCPTGALYGDWVKVRFGPMPEYEPIERMENIVYARRSIRKYTPDAVDAEELRVLCDLANQSPTGSNRQGMHFCISSPETTAELERLAREHYLGYEGPIGRRIRERGFQVTLGAPHIVGICCPQLQGELGAALTAQTLALAAPGLGIGACYNGILLRAYRDSPRMREAFPACEGTDMYVFLSLGYPAETFRRTIIKPPADIRYI